MRRLATTAFFLLTAQLHAQPSGPVLQLTTASGQTTFHIGERIPIVFSFTGPDAGTFTVSLFPINRLSGLGPDDISVSPVNNTADPLAQYLAYTGGAFSVPTSNRPLSFTAVTRQVNLNEWVRFDDPGTYAVTALSHRVSPTGKNSFIGDENRLKVKSNPLEIQIIPATPAWQKATLTRALRDLAKPAPKNGDPPESRIAAIQDLRYLATPEAISALAANLSDDHYDLQSDAIEGLAGLPRARRESALAAMNRLIEDPEFPVCAQFLEAMAFLQMDDLPLPDYEHFDRDKAQAQYTAFQTRKQLFVDTAWQATAMALRRKVEPARGATAHTLADTQPAEPPATALAQLGDVLRSSFPERSNVEKVKLLQDQWDILGSREMLPQLRTLSVLSDEDSGLGSVGGFVSARELRAIALRRWFEFEPESATREVIDQIGSATPSLNYKDLDFLPAQTLPQFEPIWAKAFRETEDFSVSDNLGGLLTRFGTGAALVQMFPQIKGPNNDPSGNHVLAALAYVVRFDPQAARPFLVSPRDQSGNCYGNVDSVSRLVENPVLTEAALTLLQSPCAGAVSDALGYLTSHGDEGARKPILDAYLQWSERWAGKPDPAENSGRNARKAQDEDEEIDRAKQIAAAELRQDYDLGNSFVAALLSNQGWLPDADLLATIRDHCNVKSICDSVERLAKPNFEIVAIANPTEKEYNVGPFRCASLKLFESKLDQFPQGTTFHLEPVYSAYPGRQRQAAAHMAALLEKHGMKLAPPTP